MTAAVPQRPPRRVPATAGMPPDRHPAAAAGARRATSRPTSAIRRRGLHRAVGGAARLPRAATRVMVLEAHRVGLRRLGAQRRAGRHRASTSRQRWLEAKVGKDAARALWDLSEAAKAPGPRPVAPRHAPEAALHARRRAWRILRRRGAGRCAGEVEHLRARYGYDQIEILPRSLRCALVKTLALRGRHPRPRRRPHPPAALCHGPGPRGRGRGRRDPRRLAEVTDVVHGTPAGV